MGSTLAETAIVDSKFQNVGSKYPYLPCRLYTPGSVVEVLRCAATIHCLWCELLLLAERREPVVTFRYTTLADLTFEASTNRLHGFGRSWSARSGTSNMGGLQAGTYFAPAHALMAGQPGYGVPVDAKYAASAYTERHGLYWFIWLDMGN